MSSLSDRRFMEELSAQLQKMITVVTSDGKNYTGILTGVDSHSLNICLTEAKDDSGRLINKLFISGNNVARISSTEKAFNLQALADKVERVFPRMVRLNEGAGVIVVMDKIRLSEKGIIEGTGPAAERVQKVYDEFVRAQTQT